MTIHLERARTVADRLRDLSQHLDALAWNLDAEISALDKDEAGYREKTAANPDGGANAVPGDLEAALVRAEALFIALPSLEQAASASLIAFSAGGTYGRWYPPTLEGLDNARAEAKAQQLGGRVVPLRPVFGGVVAKEG